MFPPMKSIRIAFLRNVLPYCINNIIKNDKMKKIKSPSLENSVDGLENKNKNNRFGFLFYDQKYAFCSDVFTYILREHSLEIQ